MVFYKGFTVTLFKIQFLRYLGFFYSYDFMFLVSLPYNVYQVISIDPTHVLSEISNVNLFFLTSCFIVSTHVLNLKQKPA